MTSAATRGNGFRGSRKDDSPLARRPDGDEMRGEGRRVLVVDDDQDIRDTLGTVLLLLGQ